MKLGLIIGAALLGTVPAISFAQSASASAKADSAVSSPAPAASGRVTRDELKQRISSQIEGHGVKQYTLEIVDAASHGDGKVLAHCEGGKKVLVYSKGATAKPDAGK